MATLKLVDVSTGAVAPQPSLQHSTVEALADFYAQYLVELEQLEWWLTVARRRLRNEISATGRTIPTEHGELYVGIDNTLRLQK